MSKPDSPKCKTCTVVNNKLRCCTCKYKTKEWLVEHISGEYLLTADWDNYKEKESSDCGAKIESEDTE